MEILFIASLLLSAAGILGQALGGSAEMRARNEQLKALQYEAGLQQREFEEAKADVFRRGEKAAGEYMMAGSKAAASQASAFAASNVDPTSKTAVATMSETMMDAQLGALIAQNNAYREAYGYEKMQSKLRREMKYAKKSKELQNLATLLNTGTQMLGTAAGAASSTYGYLRQSQVPKYSAPSSSKTYYARGPEVINS